MEHSLFSLQMYPGSRGNFFFLKRNKIMILQKKTFAAMHSHGICGATVEERLNTVLKCVELPLRMRRFRM